MDEDTEQTLQDCILALDRFLDAGNNFGEDEAEELGVNLALASYVHRFIHQEHECTKSELTLVRIDLLWEETTKPDQQVELVRKWARQIRANTFPESS